MVGWFCVGNENRDPGAADEETCELIGGAWTLRWWLAVSWPAAVYAGSQGVPAFRRHPFLVGAVVAAAAAAVWLVVATVVIDLG